MVTRPFHSWTCCPLHKAGACLALPWRIGLVLFGLFGLVSENSFWNDSCSSC